MTARARALAATRPDRAAAAERLAVPLLLLLLQAAVLYHLASRAGRLNPVNHPDTASYLELLQATSLAEAVGHYRTYGYPLFLRSLGWVGLEWADLPSAQLAAYFAAVCLFWAGLAAYSRNRWLAFAAATPLLYADARGLSAFSQPDFLSSALVLVALGALLLASGWRFSLPVLGALALAVAAAYQVRPATIFLVGWVPLVTWGLERLARPGEAARALHRAAAVLALTALPYLGFATLRLAAVGHFGLVSFGGLNLCGLAANFLDSRLAWEVSDRNRRLANSILAGRRARGWPAMKAGDDATDFFVQYSDNIWRICLDAASTWWDKDLAGRDAGAEGSGPRPPPPDPRLRFVVLNDWLGELARELVRRRPRLYLEWVRAALVYGLAQLPAHGWIRWPFLILLPAAAVALWRRRGGARRRPPARERAGVVALWAIATSFFGAYLLLTALVSFPFLRYFLSMILLIPSALSASLFAAVSWGWTAGRDATDS